MKKIFTFGLLSLLVLGVAGCGKKGTTTCTIKRQADDINTADSQIEIIIDYEGSNYTNIVGNYVYESADVAKEQYALIEEYAKENKTKINYVLEGKKIKNIVTKNDVLMLATGNINEKKESKIAEGLKKAGYSCK